MSEGPGLKILGEISIPERKIPKTMSLESRKRAAEVLPAALVATVERLNGTIREKLPSLDERQVLLSDGRIDMEAFRKENGGPHADGTVESD
ncbi:MAG: hypothetical protein HGA31_06395, partial [Candidatus Moranbacteria bacterium]|nr:hypothetical protein [Candidatus Moranbacteria bacterium]